MNSLLLLSAGVACLAACASHPSPNAPDFASKVDETMQSFRDADPDLGAMIDSAHGFAVFPDVGKGGFVIGAGSGSGYVYEGSQLIGTATIKTLTVGATVGGQGFSELILFETPAALEEFKNGEYEFSAAVEAVAANKGVSKHARFEDGVAVFTVPKGGLMADASVGGQKFSFRTIAAGSRP